jgi:truncated hemoglobin YjbI
MGGASTLFSRLGGEAGLAHLIDLHYQRLLTDDYLGEYFMGVDIDRLKAAQLAFLRAAFGDTEMPYRGASLRAAHQGQLVTEHAFDQFVDLFVTAAAETGASEADRSEIRAALKATRASVITEFSPNPAYDYQSKPF